MVYEYQGTQYNTQMATDPGLYVRLQVSPVGASVGRVSMDMLAVDLTALTSSGFGSEVTLWGQGPKGSLLPIDEVARAAGTIGYELMCALAPRVPVTVQHPVS